MHQSSFNIMTRFKELAHKHFGDKRLKLLDVGSYGVNGTYKEIFSDTSRFDYTGLDVTPGPNVDYVPSDPYVWAELADETFDVIISGQAFEHIEFPWLIIDEMNRVLRGNGLICIVAPSRGPEHKYPVDCWRYYPDGFRALAKWTGLEVMDSRTFWGASGFSDGSDQWGDTYCVLHKSNDSAGNREKKHRERRSFVSANRNSPLRTAKKDSYYGFARKEVIEALIRNRVPVDRVLELGCAGGATGKGLKEKAGSVYYVGVEMSQEAAEIAAQSLDKVIIADIETTDLQKEHGLKHHDFDLVVALDVLEHLYDPWDVLKELTNFVRPGGHVVVSIPNVQNITVIQNLINGKWQYEDAGILDATHLRFFSLSESVKLIEGAGLKIKNIDRVMNPPLDMSKVKIAGNRFKQGNLEISNMSKEDITNLFTYQFVIIAEKETSRVGAGSSLLRTSGSHNALNNGPEFQRKDIVNGLTSIVILTFNQLKYTKECVDSIRKFTPEPHEIIFVDNGSTDGSVKWLRELVENNANYRLIENTENLGFAKGCNQGINASSGEYILLLNNDVVVTSGWLSGLMECLEKAPDSGIVGPMTNNIRGPQRVKDVGYKSTKEIESYAELFRNRYEHRRIPLRMIVGFCMLFRRSLVDIVGLLDESFGVGNFEDDDYCIRAELEGYRNYIAGGVFIHHYGSRSFTGNRINYNATLAENRKIFNAKWTGAALNPDLSGKLSAVRILDHAGVAYQKGKPDTAFRLYMAGIKRYPGNRTLYISASEMLIDSKQFQIALDLLNQMPGDDENIMALVFKGYCEEGLEHPDSAMRYADQALAMEQDYPLAVNLKGLLAYKNGDKNAALKFFKKAAQLDPGYGEPYTNLGLLSWQDGERHKAFDLIERGFLMSPTVGDIVTHYYSTLTELHAYERGIPSFRDAVTLFPDNQRLVFLLTDLLLKTGKYEEAMDVIEDSLIKFGIEDGMMMKAALAVREKLGPKAIDRKKTGKGRTLSLCMIVKNEEKHLAGCLNSVKHLADEIIVADTGSEDRTADIAEIFGARVFDIEWKGDFASARNISLEHAKGDWILVLDADECIAAKDKELLRDLIEKSGNGRVAYQMDTRNYSKKIVANWRPNNGEYTEEAGSGWFPSTKVRLFPNNKKIRFVNPVHELVESSVTAAGFKIKHCSVPVHHYGKLDIKRTAEKGEAYFLLGMEKLKQNGQDEKALFELAVQATELGRYEDAVGLWERLTALRPDFDTAYISAVKPYAELGMLEDALRVAKKGLQLSPEKNEAVYHYSLCEYYMGHYSEASEILEKFIGNNPDYPMTLALLANIYMITGRRDKGMELIERLNGMRFGYLDFACSEISKLASFGRTADACALSKALLACNLSNLRLLKLQRQHCGFDC